MGLICAHVCGCPCVCPPQVLRVHTCFGEPVPRLFWEDLHVMGTQPCVCFQVCPELMGVQGVRAGGGVQSTEPSPCRPAGPGAGTQGGGAQRQECAQGLPLGSLGPGHAVHGRQNGEDGRPRAQPLSAHTRLSPAGPGPSTPRPAHPSPRGHSCHAASCY